jgi:Zinc carboxypeptidase
MWPELDRRSFQEGHLKHPFRKCVLPALAAIVGSLAFSGTASAQSVIGPPFCAPTTGDGVANLPTGANPGDPVGSFPHIPYAAIGCTLDAIAARSNGRMRVRIIGQSAQGRPMYLASFNVLETPQQRRAYRNWLKIRRLALINPTQAQRELARMGGNVKVPLFIQSGIHGNESEGVDSSLMIIERLATTPTGTDPEVDAILNNSIVLFNVVQNPDGRVLNQRTNGNSFDLNRDFLTQSQSETRASVRIMQRWLPPEVLDLHGYVTPTLIEATTKPHNPSIEYDLWLKWNQARIDANEAAMNANGYAVTRPINDWCSNGDTPDTPGGPCDDGRMPGPGVAEGWDDWGPFYTPMYAQHVGLNGSTVEMCNSTGTACLNTPTSTAARGRLGSRTMQYIITWSTLLFDVANRVALTHDQLEFYERGVRDAPRPACCPAPFDVANNWMTNYPKAFVIPIGPGQRSNAEANRLVRWLLANGIEVSVLRRSMRFGAGGFRKGSYVVWMQQAKRGLAGTALGIGDDISTQINELYAPPASWSHGYLWGADVVTIGDDAAFGPATRRIRRAQRVPGGLDAGAADRYALKIDSPTAVRVLNRLLGTGTMAQLALASFSTPSGTLPAGTAIFAADAATAATLDRIGEENGLRFRRATAASLPAVDPMDRPPRIAVLTAAVNQDVWSLRDLGFPVEPVATGGTSQLNSPTQPDPLLNYDVVFNTAGWPTGTTAQARLTAFFARGGGYIGAGTGGATFLTSSAQASGIAAASRGGAGRSGIVWWENTGGASSPIVGPYPGRDTAIMDPPTWFTSVPSSWTVDGRFPMSGILASGFWVTSDAQSVTAPGSPVIVHGTNTAGTSRMTVFAMNPLYRADPEREWPAVSLAAFWGDQ